MSLTRLTAKYGMKRYDAMLQRFRKLKDKGKGWLGNTCQPLSMQQYTWHRTKNLPIQVTIYTNQQGQQKRHTKVPIILRNLDYFGWPHAIISNMQSRGKSSRRFCLNSSRRKESIEIICGDFGQWVYGITNGMIFKDHQTNQRAGKIGIQRVIRSQLANINIFQKDRGLRAAQWRCKISMATRTKYSASLRKKW